jgi:hypothetical protein
MINLTPLPTCQIWTPHEMTKRLRIKLTPPMRQPQLSRQRERKSQRNTSPSHYTAPAGVHQMPFKIITGVHYIPFKIITILFKSFPPPLPMHVLSSLPVCKKSFLLWVYRDGFVDSNHFSVPNMQNKTPQMSSA